jgi:glycosyltransferase involved in cell wall biosynthesis
LYDDDAYVEAGGAALGLMGRQVAGRGFLEAYLAHGAFSELAAVAATRESAESLVRLWNQARSPLPGRAPRTLRVIERGTFHENFFPDPPATVVHAPQPPDPALAWARQRAGSHGFALSGVTHTLASRDAAALLRELVTAPFQPYDTLFCTSRAVASMVAEVTETYSGYLRDRMCRGEPAAYLARSTPVRLETIPLGVDVDRFRPATHAERISARKTLDVTDDEVVILFVGRLSHHAKAHPFPLYRAASEAALGTGRKVHLILAGWAAHPAVRAAFADGAKTFAPAARVSIVDGRDPGLRSRVWHAADLFASPSDSVQETFGLAVAEAMASGLPVVASDWDGYRDLVSDGQTGFLVPTTMVPFATADLTARLLTGETGYDHFLAEIGQTTMVDTAAMTAAITRLVADSALRRQMGMAGRERACSEFAWPSIIRAYERVWSEQDAERLARNRACNDDQTKKFRDQMGPAAYPAPERTFAGYPTRQLAPADHLLPGPSAAEMLDLLLDAPLTNHIAGRRVADRALLHAALSRAPCSVADLDALWSSAGVELRVARATLGWMLKYDLLCLTWSQSPDDETHG